MTVSGIVIRTSDLQPVALKARSFLMVLLTDGSKDDFRDILRGAFTIEAMISVDSRRKVWNDLLSTQPEIISTFILINSCDCEGPCSVDRESEFIPPTRLSTAFQTLRACRRPIHSPLRRQRATLYKVYCR